MRINTKFLGFVAVIIVLLLLQFPASAQLPTNLIPSGGHFYPDDYVWNVRIDNTTLFPISSTYNASTINAISSLYGYQYSAFYINIQNYSSCVAPNCYVQYMNPRTSGAFSGSYWRYSNDLQVPIPAAVQIESGSSDRYMLIYDPSQSMLYESVPTVKTSDTYYSTAGIYVWNLNNLTARPPGWTSASAGGMPFVPGMPRSDEFASQEIHHALVMTVQSGILSPSDYVYPAKHAAGTGSAVPIGVRLRLKSGFSESGLTTNQITLVRALKKYGAIITDSNGANPIMGFPTEIDAPATSMSFLHGRDFEVIDQSWYIYNESSWQVRNPSGSASGESDPYAGYVPTSINGTEPLNVQFTDVSYNNPSTWIWNATDVSGVVNNGQSFTFSTVKNPVYTFYRGNYSIQLNASNTMGYNKTPVGVFVNVSGGVSAPVVNFTADKTIVAPGELVQFTDTSSVPGTSWQWAFGEDLFSDNTQNPVHYYLNDGVYSVTLKATNAAGSAVFTRTNYITVSTVYVPIIANFTPVGSMQGSNVEEIWVTKQNGIPLTMNFQDTTTWGSSIGTRTRLWTIRDGDTATYYTTQNVTYTFNNLPTWYNYAFVELTSSIGANSDTKFKWIRMTTDATPTNPRFRAYNVSKGQDIHVELGTPNTSYINISTGDVVTFTDESLNYPTQTIFTVEFAPGLTQTYAGIGGYSFNYTYGGGFIDQSGVYNVTLTSVNDVSSNTITVAVINYTKTTPPPSISTPVWSNIGPTQVQWNWTLPSPIHNYGYVSLWKNGVLFENITYPQNGTVWSNLTPSTVVSIGAKSSSSEGYMNTTWVNNSATTNISSWQSTTPGSYTWVCPPGVYNISVYAVAGGGAGKNAYYLSGYVSGLGGLNGQIQGISRLSVTPGTTYYYTVPSGGAAQAYTGTSIPANPGGDITGFLGSVNSKGGLGGASGTYSTPGGNGSAGYNVSPYVTASNGTGGTFGYGGSGYGAGGGGAGYAVSGLGGAGTSGYLNITIYGYQTGNIPQFIADITTGAPALLVHFRDLSSIPNSDGLTYNWSFGDGTYSTTPGDVTHVYSYTGVYDVSLTLNSTSGKATELKTAYILCTNQNTQNTWWTPHVVQITIMDTYGQRLANVRIDASYNESTVPITWINQLYGIMAGPQGDMVNKTLIMSGTSGSDGTLTFTMLGSLRYDMFLSSPQYNLNRYYVTAFPSDSMLNIYVTPPGQQLITTAANSTYAQLNGTRVYVLEPDINTVSMCIDYCDTAGLTSVVNESWVFTNNNTVFHSESILNPGTAMITKCYNLPNQRGTQVWWGYNATRSAQINA